MALYRTLGNVCHPSNLIWDALECLSHAWPYTGHLGMSHSSSLIGDTWECPLLV